MSDSELPNENAKIDEKTEEPARIRTRKTSRNAVVVTISSDSECEEVEDEKITKKNAVGGERISTRSSVGGEKVTTRSSVEGEKITTRSSVEGEKITTRSSVEGEKITTRSTVEGEKIIKKSAVEEEKLIKKSAVEREKITKKSTVEKDKMTADTKDTNQDNSEDDDEEEEEDDEDVDPTYSDSTSRSEKMSTRKETVSSGISKNKNSPIKANQNCSKKTLLHRRFSKKQQDEKEEKNENEDLTCFDSTSKSEKGSTKMETDSPDTSKNKNLPIKANQNYPKKSLLHRRFSKKQEEDEENEDDDKFEDPTYHAGHVKTEKGCTKTETDSSDTSKNKNLLIKAHQNYPKRTLLQRRFSKNQEEEYDDEEENEEDDDDEFDDPTYQTGVGKTEKGSTKKETDSSDIFKNKNLPIKANQNYPKRTLLHRRFLRKPSTAPTASRIIPRKKNLPYSTSYFNRKCKLLAQQNKRRGRPKKYATDEEQLRNNNGLTSPRKQSIDGTSNSSTEKAENERQFNDSAPGVSQLKKRGRPKLLPLLRKKRGRPKLIENKSLIKKKPKTIRTNNGNHKKVLNNDFTSKRGRPKTITDADFMERKKRSKLLRNPEVKLRKHTSRPFLQHVNCLNEAMRIPKCRECRKAAYNRSTWDMSSTYCRFLEYRKLLATENGTAVSAGFLQPSDSTEYDKRMWLPNLTNPPKDLIADTSKELLIQVGDQFCDLVQQETEALSLHIGEPKNMTWKKLVQGVREMCDVCETTLFNIHWVCPKCGFSVCIDCYKVRKQGIIVEHEEEEMRGKDEFLWLYCHNKVPHKQDGLIKAQVVPGDALWTMNKVMHYVRKKFNIEAYCKCIPQDTNSATKNSVATGICKQLMCTVSKSFATINVADSQPFADDISFLNMDVPDRAAEWINKGYDENFAIKNNSKETCEYPCFEMCSSFSKDIATPFNCGKVSSLSIADLFKSIVEFKSKRNKTSPSKEVFNCFDSRYPQMTEGQYPLRIFTVTESSVLYKDVPHSWLCSGRLLLLHQPDHVENIRLFQEQWKRGQPIMVMGIDRKLDMSLWHPDGFCRDFGDIKNDLVNCKTGAIIPDLPMKKFWLGFENFEERMKDEDGDFMLLKLKDWPPGEDFSEKLPKRFHDLMRGLPLPEYTHRDGIFNLAGRLPSWFVRPDLGPKMYNAYGSALFPTKGTTNLHLDISDAVNVMVYVGIPHDGKDEQHILEALKAIDEGGCDSLTKERVRSKGVRPGALWHIYDARSTDKIRDLLAKVAIERGEKLEANHDPIHDQSWYLDTELRKRLSVEYGVEGYAIAQCLGDAVFIPAGAPHQVRNLHSCVKVAEDFVSPENIAHCFKLTQEFRHLSDTHTNHEDKLQIKNIIYHVVKDALSHLLDQNEYARFILNHV